MPSVAENLARVRERIAAAAERAGRPPADITLVAVSKTQPVAAIEEALAAGATDFGENYAQELRDKYAAIGDRARWHFIGHPQTNKLRYIVPQCALIHSVDSERLAVEIGRRAARLGPRQPVLLEVNLAGEQSKFGLSPEQVRESAPAMAALPAVELRGLMTMPPLAPDPEASRPYYTALRELAESLREAGLPGETVRELSMGMTADLEVAIAEGATIIRVGTAIFGPRRG